MSSLCEKDTDIVALKQLAPRMQHLANLAVRFHALRGDTAHHLQSAQDTFGALIAPIYSGGTTSSLFLGF